MKQNMNKFVLSIFLFLTPAMVLIGQNKCLKVFNGKEYLIEFLKEYEIIEIGDKSSNEKVTFIRPENWELGEIKFERDFRSVAQELLTEKQLSLFQREHKTISYQICLNSNAVRVWSLIIIPKGCFDFDGEDLNKLSFSNVVRLKEVMDKEEIVIGNPQYVGKTEKEGCQIFTMNALLYK